jgi:hypothetical protein
MPPYARPFKTMRAIQPTDFGIDQSSMMTVHSAKIRAKLYSDFNIFATPQSGA